MLLPHPLHPQQHRAHRQNPEWQPHNGVLQKVRMCGGLARSSYICAVLPMNRALGRFPGYRPGVCPSVLGFAVVQPQQFSITEPTCCLFYITDSPPHPRRDNWFFFHPGKMGEDWVWTESSSCSKWSQQLEQKDVTGQESKALKTTELFFALPLSCWPEPLHFTSVQIVWNLHWLEDLGVPGAVQAWMPIVFLLCVYYTLLLFVCLRLSVDTPSKLAPNSHSSCLSIHSASFWAYRCVAPSLHLNVFFGVGPPSCFLCVSFPPLDPALHMVPALLKDMSTLSEYIFIVKTSAPSCQPKTTYGNVSHIFTRGHSLLFHGWLERLFWKYLLAKIESFFVGTVTVGLKQLCPKVISL